MSDTQSTLGSVSLQRDLYTSESVKLTCQDDRCWMTSYLVSRKHELVDGGLFSFDLYGVPRWNLARLLIYNEHLSHHRIISQGNLLEISWNIYRNFMKKRVKKGYFSSRRVTSRSGCNRGMQSSNDWLRGLGTTEGFIPWIFSEISGKMLRIFSPGKRWEQCTPLCRRLRKSTGPKVLSRPSSSLPSFP